MAEITGGEVVETFFTEGLEVDDFLRDFVDYWNSPGTWDQMPDNRKGMWVDLQPKILSEVRLLCYDKTAPPFYSDISHPILITQSRETPPHQYEACSIAASSLPNSRLVNVSGGHMALITKPDEVGPHLARWINTD